MKEKSKLKTIIQAFTTEGDVSEELFNERLKICESCEYSTANKAPEDISMADKLKVGTICEGSPVCTACGCCILKKIGIKTTECGLVDKGLEPKWNAVKVETTKDIFLDVEVMNKTAESISLIPKQEAFLVELGDIKETVKEVDLLITRKAGLNISTIKAACSCTVPTQEKVDKDTVRIKAKINTLGFTKNEKFTKSITVYYFVNATGTRSTIIKLTGTKR